MCKNIRDYYSEKLRIIKNNLGMTIEEMAYTVGMNKGGLSTNISAKSLPREKTHKLIISKLNINPNFFFFDDEDIFNKKEIIWTDKTYNQKIKEIYKIYGLTQLEFSKKYFKRYNSILNCLRSCSEASFIVIYDIVDSLGINPAFFYCDNEPMYKKINIDKLNLDNNANNKWLKKFKRLTLVKEDFVNTKDEDYKTYIVTSLRKRLTKMIINK